MHTNTGALIAFALAACLAQPAFAQPQRTPDKATPSLQLQRGEHAGPELRPVIGVVLSPDAVAGVRISGVTPNGGGAKAGLQAGDRIVTIKGKQVDGSSGEKRLRDAQKLLSRLEAGSPVRIGYVRNGKPASVEVMPQVDHAVYFLQDDGSLLRAEGDVRVRSNDAGERRIIADRFVVTPAPGVPPKVHREIIRIGPGTACKGRDCDMPALLSAFRWNGLNLATIDKQLGRYFGTDRGVLVLSTGSLAGLQAGDVIQRIDGKAVASPREAMAAMGNKPGGATVSIDYLRDRKAGKAQVTVPELEPLPLPPAPPAPPAPPEPPKPPKAPPAPPTPPAPQAMAPTAPVAPAPPAPPAPTAPGSAGVIA